MNTLMDLEVASFIKDLVAQNWFIGFFLVSDNLVADESLLYLSVVSSRKGIHILLVGPLRSDSVGGDLIFIFHDLVGTIF